MTRTGIPGGFLILVVRGKPQVLDRGSKGRPADQWASTEVGALVQVVGRFLEGGFCSVSKWESFQYWNRSTSAATF